MLGAFDNFIPHCCLYSTFRPESETILDTLDVVPNLRLPIGDIAGGTRYPLNFRRRVWLLYLRGLCVVTERSSLCVCVCVCVGGGGGGGRCVTTQKNRCVGDYYTLGTWRKLKCRRVVFSNDGKFQRYVQVITD